MEPLPNFNRPLDCASAFVPAGLRRDKPLGMTKYTIRNTCRDERSTAGDIRNTHHAMRDTVFSIDSVRVCMGLQRGCRDSRPAL